MPDTKVPGNRKEFLEVLRGAFGYDGPADLTKVKAFLNAAKDSEDGEIVIVGDDNEPIDVDTIWAKTGPARVLRFNQTASETEDETETRLSGKSSARQTAGNAGRVNAAHAKITGKIGDRVSSAKRAYDMRAKQGAALFPDADMAEACCAYLRAASAVVNKGSYSQLDADLEIIEKAGSGVNMTTGGAFVPDDFRAQLIYLSEPYGVTRRVANVISMSRDTMTLPRQVGEFAFSYSAENTALTDDEVDTDQINVTAVKAFGYAKLPSELLDDAAINVTDIYARAFAKGIAKAEDQAYLLGDGTVTYGRIVGILNAVPSTTFVAQGSGSTWGAMTEADFNALVGRVENADHTNCAFICSRQFYFQVMMPLSAASGRGTINEYLTVNGTGGRADAQWRGWPVYFSQVMPTATATSQKPVYFGDFRAASIFGDRKELMIATSEHVLFGSDQVAIRAIQRFGINVHGDGRSSTYGPISGIKTS